MKYTNELAELKKARQFQQDFTNIVNQYSPFMTEKALQQNISKSQMMINIYDQKIAKLEELAKQEEQKDIVDAVVSAVNSQDKYVSRQIEKSLESVFKTLKL